MGWGWVGLVRCSVPWGWVGLVLIGVFGVFRAPTPFGTPSRIDPCVPASECESECAISHPRRLPGCPALGPYPTRFGVLSLAGRWDPRRSSSSLPFEPAGRSAPAATAATSSFQRPTGIVLDCQAVQQRVGSEPETFFGHYMVTTRSQ